MVKMENKSIHFIVLTCFLLFLCIGSVKDYLYTNSKNTIVVEDDNSQVLSVKNHQVTQTLRLEGELSELNIYISAPSGMSYEDAEVTFLIKQGKQAYKEKVKAKNLGTTYMLTMPKMKFRSGEAILSVSGEQFPNETDLFLLCSSTQTSGLDAAKMDGNITEGPLLINYTVMRHDGYFIYDTVFIILLMVVILSVSWLVTFRKKKAEETGLLFVCSTILVFIYISLRNPMATFLADPVSEMTYEFWYKARYMSFGENMMSLMSGESLAWTERILMWLAVKLAGNGKYVFVIAQIMQTILVSCFSSMICLPTFRRWFPAEIRLLLCWYLGGALLFPSAYYFWAVSYWASFFIIPFAFVDMEKLKRWQYAMAMTLTMILCISRIYHILYIPMALIALFALGKIRGKRFSGYCFIIAVSSAFEVVYSILKGGSGHLDLSQLKPMKFFGNAIYYQVQVLRSLFLGNGKFQDSMLNVLFLLFFIFVIGVALYLLVYNWKDIEKRTYGTFLVVLGILSFGSILINVTVCGCSTSIAFPTNYAAPVKWSKNYYQAADLHFSYSYYAILLILLTISHLYFRFYREKTSWQTKRIKCEFAVLICLFVCVNNQGYHSVRSVETDWKSCFWVTAHDSYYMPVNASYQFANISLYHNSFSIICGMTDEGKEVSWAQGSQSYSSTYEYSTISPGKVSDLEKSEMLSITVRKANMNFLDPMVAVLKNEKGEEIARVSQTNRADRYYSDFMLEEPVYGVYTIDFQYKNGREAKIKDGVQIGIVQGK